MSAASSPAFAPAQPRTAPTWVTSSPRRGGGGGGSSAGATHHPVNHHLHPPSQPRLVPPPRPVTAAAVVATSCSSFSCSSSPSTNTTTTTHLPSSTNNITPVSTSTNPPSPDINTTAVAVVTTTDTTITTAGGASTGAIPSTSRPSDPHQQSSSSTYDNHPHTSVPLSAPSMQANNAVASSSSASTTSPVPAPPVVPAAVAAIAAITTTTPTTAIPPGRRASSVARSTRASSQATPEIHPRALQRARMSIASTATPPPDANRYATASPAAPTANSAPPDEPVASSSSPNPQQAAAAAATANNTDAAASASASVDGGTPDPGKLKKRPRRGWKGWAIEIVDEYGNKYLRSPSPEPERDPDAPPRRRGRPRTRPRVDEPPLATAAAGPSTATTSATAAARAATVATGETESNGAAAAVHDEDGLDRAALVDGDARANVRRSNTVNRSATDSQQQAAPTDDPDDADGVPGHFMDVDNEQPEDEQADSAARPTTADSSSSRPAAVMPRWRVGVATVKRGSSPAAASERPAAKKPRKSTPATMTSANASTSASAPAPARAVSSQVKGVKGPRRSEPVRRNGHAAVADRQASSSRPSSRGAATGSGNENSSPLLQSAPLPGRSLRPAAASRAQPAAASSSRGGKAKTANSGGKMTQRSLDEYLAEEEKQTLTPRLGMGAVYPSPPESDERHERAAAAAAGMSDAGPPRPLPPDVAEEARFIIKQSERRREIEESEQRTRVDNQRQRETAERERDRVRREQEREEWEQQGQPWLERQDRHRGGDKPAVRRERERDYDRSRERERGRDREHGRYRSYERDWERGYDREPDLHERDRGYGRERDLEREREAAEYDKSLRGRHDPAGDSTSRHDGRTSAHRELMSPPYASPHHQPHYLHPPPYGFPTGSYGYPHYGQPVPHPGYPATAYRQPSYPPPPPHVDGSASTTSSRRPSFSPRSHPGDMGEWSSPYPSRRDRVLAHQSGPPLAGGLPPPHMLPHLHGPPPQLPPTTQHSPLHQPPPLPGPPHSPHSRQPSRHERPVYTREHHDGRVGGERRLEPRPPSGQDLSPIRHHPNPHAGQVAAPASMGYTDVRPVPFPTGSPYTRPEPRPPRIDVDYPAVVLAPPGQLPPPPTSRSDVPYARAYTQGLEGLDPNLEDNARGFVENVKNNLRTLVQTYFVEPSASRDAFLEKIGRDLTQLGWELTDSADGALYSRAVPARGRGGGGGGGVARDPRELGGRERERERERERWRERAWASPAVKASEGEQGVLGVSDVHVVLRRE